MNVRNDYYGTKKKYTDICERRPTDNFFIFSISIAI